MPIVEDAGRRGFVDVGEAKPYLVQVTEDMPAAADMIPKRGSSCFPAARIRRPASPGRSNALRAVETIGFDYGQRHRIELECRAAVLDRLRREFPDWGAKLGEDHLVDLGVLGQLSDTALTRETAIAFAGSGLPNTFVPGRNLLFFTFAAAIGYRRGARHLVGGMCETDYSGYPDCRDDTLKALQATLSLGMDHRFVIHTPLMWRDKAATWELARRARRRLRSSS